MKVYELAEGRAGDKGDVLDLTLVAYDDEGYALLELLVDAPTVATWLAAVGPAGSCGTSFRRCAR